MLTGKEGIRQGINNLLKSHLQPASPAWPLSELKIPACKNPLKIGAMETADCRMPLRFPSSPVGNICGQQRFHPGWDEIAYVYCTMSLVHSRELANIQLRRGRRRIVKRAFVNMTWHLRVQTWRLSNRLQGMESRLVREVSMWFIGDFGIDLLRLRLTMSRDSS